MSFLLACISPLATRAEPPLDRSPSSSAAAPRARVVIVQNDRATDAFDAQPEAVRHLVQQGITNFTGQPDPSAAWRTLINSRETIGIKVYSLPGPAVGTRPAVVAAVVEGLLAAGFATNKVVIWDRQLSDLRRAGFGRVAEQYGVRLAGAFDSGWDEATYYDSALLGQLVYGDLQFQQKGEGVGRKSFVSKLLTRDITRIINVSPLLNHNSVGVCGNLYSLAFGSVDNTIRFEGNAAKLSEAVPDIYNLPGLGDHVSLNIVDALVCQYEGEQIGRLHNSIALNELRFSKDPVALDVLSIEEIIRQRGRAEGLAAHTNRMDLYRNAALLDLGTAEPKKIDLHTIKAAE